MRLELTRLWLRPLKAAWLPITPPGLKYNMASQREVDLVNRMLSSIPKTYDNLTQQILYERGYLTGFLASLAYNDNAVRDAIIDRIRKLEGR